MMFVSTPDSELGEGTCSKTRWSISKVWSVPEKREDIPVLKPAEVYPRSDYFLSWEKVPVLLPAEVYLRFD